MNPSNPPPARRSAEVVCFGEALVDLLPTSTGPLESVPSFERHPGGAPANVAIGVARLGRRCALVGAVGSDPFGRYVLSALAAEGVDVSGLRPLAGAKTGIAFVALDPEGRPRFYSPGQSVAELQVDEAHVDGVDLSEARVAHLSTALLRSPGSRAATFRFVARAREAGLWVAFDPNLRLHHFPDPAVLAGDVRRLVDLSSVVKLSDAEVAFVAGTADPLEGAKRLVSGAPRLAVVTTGPQGAVWALRHEAGRLATGRVEARRAAVVDTTGAGDAFQAALIDGLLGLPSLEALNEHRLVGILARACEAGSRVCERVGAVAGLPHLFELPRSL
jgi:fructokinase